MTRMSAWIVMATLVLLPCGQAAAEGRAELLARSAALAFPPTAAGEAACFGRLSRAMLESRVAEAGPEALVRGVAAVGHVCEGVHARRGAMDQACALAAVLRPRPGVETCDAIEPRAALWWAEMVEERPEAMAALSR